MVSIREVAKLANVSPATVSRVMNGTARVDEEKKQRVERVIEETGFRPNEVARSLYKKSAHIIGIIVPNIENPFFNEMARVIEGEAYKKGYRLTLCNSNDDSEKEIDNINLLNRMNADGIILLTNADRITDGIKKCTIPVIIMDREVKLKNEIALIQSDHYTGGKLAVEHLLDCGCRNIVYLCGPLKLSSAKSRQKGYLDVCSERGITPQYLEGEYSYEAGLKLTETLLERYPDVDGIMAANDMVAVSIYKVLSGRGYRVPEDIQLIGFDNIKLSELVTPAITTIEQPIAKMGKTAVKELIAYIEGRQIQKRNIFDVKLIQRETTKKRKEE